ALGEARKATVYYPYSQHDWYANMYLTVRTSLPMAAVFPVIRRVVAEVNPRVPVFEATTMTERINASLAPRRLAMTVLVGLAAVSLGLAVLGLYGILSYAVSQRASEFGIRVALGARPAQVRRMVVREGLGLGVAGIAVGLVVAFVAARGLTALLFGVSPRDPASYLRAAAMLTVVAVVASYLPARRATRVNPLETLKAE
ncbi:MAG TPA: FtsX-like permease family protein, partial [Gemmatimonadales bacterium]|nr:FtsX-like permease family protein [Gemmatimonadales bacterium]